MMSRGLSRGWMSWSVVWRQHRLQRQRLRRGASRMMSRGVSRGWMGWCAMTAERAAKLALVRRGLAFFARGSECAALACWRASIERRAPLRRAAKHMLSRGLSKGINSWKERWRESVLMRRSVARAQNHQLARGWEAWHAATLFRGASARYSPSVAPVPKTRASPHAAAARTSQLAAALEAKGLAHFQRKLDENLSASTSEQLCRLREPHLQVLLDRLCYISRPPPGTPRPTDIFRSTSRCFSIDCSCCQAIGYCCKTLLSRKGRRASLRERLPRARRSPAAAKTGEASEPHLSRRRRGKRRWRSSRQLYPQDDAGRTGRVSTLHTLAGRSRGPRALVTSRGYEYSRLMAAARACSTISPHRTRQQTSLVMDVASSECWTSARPQWALGASFSSSGQTLYAATAGNRWSASAEPLGEWLGSSSRPAGLRNSGSKA